MEYSTISNLRKFTALFLGMAIAISMLLATALPASAQNLSLRDFVELLISLGIISPDKAAQARQAVSGTTTPGTGGSGTQFGVPANFLFTRNLTIGSTGTDVLYLQRILNASADTRLAASGPGSPGFETTYFGPITRSAVIRFQNKYRAEVLTPLGLAAGTGFVGPSTRAKLNALLTVTTPPVVVVPPPTGGTPPVVSPSTCTITTTGVEGSLSATQTNAGLPSTIYEDDDQVGILGVRLEARNSDICVQRVKLDLGTDTKIYNKILSRIYVTDGSTVFASQNLNANTVVREGGRYYITISGFNMLVARNATRNLIIKADVQPNIDSTDIDTETYTVRLDADGIRGIDGAGIDQYAGDTTITRTLSVDESLRESASLTVSLNTASPRKTDVVATSGSTENEIDRMALFNFDVRAERDDITITDLVVAISKSGSGAATASTTAYLYEGNTEIDSATVASGGTATFSDVDYVVPRGTTKTLGIRVDIRNANATEARFTGSVSDITAENAQGTSITESGTATGYSIGIRNVGPEITLLSSSITTSGVPQSDTANNLSTSTLTATFNVRLRAVGGAITFGTVASSTPAFASSTTGFKVYRDGAFDASIGSAATTTSYSTPSGVTTSGLTESWTLAEGNEVTIPVQFLIVGRRPNGVSLPRGSIYAVGMEGVQWVGPTGTGTTTFMAGESEWRTAGVSFP